MAWGFYKPYPLLVARNKYDGSNPSVPIYLINSVYEII